MSSGRVFGFAGLVDLMSGGGVAGMGVVAAGVGAVAAEGVGAAAIRDTAKVGGGFFAPLVVRVALATEAAAAGGEELGDEEACAAAAALEVDGTAAAEAKLMLPLLEDGDSEGGVCESSACAAGVDEPDFDAPRLLAALGCEIRLRMDARPCFDMSRRARAGLDVVLEGEARENSRRSQTGSAGGLECTAEGTEGEGKAGEAGAAAAAAAAEFAAAESPERSELIDVFRDVGARCRAAE